MKIREIIAFFSCLCLLLLSACSGGGGGDDDSGPPTPVITTDYSVDFSSQHVIGAVAVPETVSATASLRSASGDDFVASGDVTISGTTATSVTINAGYAGENGAVAVALTDAGGGRWTIPSGTELDLDELRRLESSGYYVRIQSADGELRGQILPPGWTVATISLDAASVVSGSTSTGSAKAGFAIDPLVGVYYVRMTVEGVSDVTSAGLRIAIAGSVGDLAASLEESMTTPGVWGSRDINDANANDLLTLTGIDLLGSGQFYLSLESASNPDGALRGQIIDDTIRIFYTEMTSSEVVSPGTPVVSDATGYATTTWVEPLSRLGVAVNTDIPNALSVGVYQGPAGEEGTLILSLMQDAMLAGNWYLSPTDLSTEQTAAFESGDLYVSIVTLGNPNGELRGQLTVPSPGATIKLIGPTGGEVSTPDGVTLSVPPGALSAPVPISVARLQGTESLPAPIADPVVPLNAAVDFGPSGTEFAFPVTLTIDLEKAAPPRASQPLLVHDPETSTWRETDLIATVDDDGDSATVDLTHFSDYAVTFSEKGSAGYFGEIDLLTENRQVIFNRIRNRFHTAFFTDTTARPYDPGTIPKNDKFFPGQDLFNCYSPFAATYVLDTFRTSTSNGVSSTERDPIIIETDGRTEDATFIMGFSRSYDRLLATTGHDDEIVVTLGAIAQVIVYYFAVSPTVAVEADPQAVWAPDESDVSAQVLCGKTGFREQDTALTLTDSVNGSVTPTEGTTDGDGRFDTVFSPNANAGGDILLRATSDWSEPVSDSMATVSATTNIEVFSLTGTWSGSGSETVTGCENPEDNGRIQGDASYTLNQNGDAISGSGFWTSFSGTVTNRQPNGAFSINGNFTDGGDDPGRGTFRGNGSAATGTLSLTWNGSSTDDTCVFSGSGTVTRQ